MEREIDPGPKPASRLGAVVLGVLLSALFLVWIAVNNSRGQTELVTGADLSVAETDSPDPVTVGENLIYTVTVTNNGPDAATGVVLRDTLSEGMMHVSSTVSQGSCSQAAGVVTCDLGSLADGSSATVTIVVTSTEPGGITNTAYGEANETDPDPSNNTATTTTIVNPAADLSVSQSGSPDPVKRRKKLTYTMTVTNQGPSAAKGLKLVNKLPDKVSFVSATGSQGTCFQEGDKVTCHLRELAQGATAQVTIIIKPRAAGIIENAVNVTSSVPDPIISNNRSKMTTTVE